MSDNLKNDVKKIVNDIFEQKEESNIRKETQAALEKSATTIVELTESLEAKDEELVNSKEQIVELENTVAGFDTTIKGMEKAKEEADAEKETWEAEKAELVKKAEEAEETLDNMKKDQLAAVRLSELSTEGVASKAEEVQLAKVREMSDEEFAAYKEELVSIKESIMAQIESKEEESTETETEEAEEKETEETETADTEEEEEEEEEIKPTQVAHAALNMEVTPSKAMTQKYEELGKAMAKKSTKSKE